MEYKDVSSDGFSIRLINGDLPASFVQNLIDGSNSGVSIDIETGGLDYRSDKIGSIQVFDGSNSIYILRPPFRDGAENFVRLMANESVTKIFHHAMFDLRFLAYHLAVAAKNVQCTKIAAKIVLPDMPKHSLVGVIDHYLGVELDKGQQRSDWFKDSLTPDQVSYAVRDVIYLPKIRNLLLRDAFKSRRRDLVIKSFQYIPTRVKLDLMGASDVFVY